ncbi:TetR/AcrR family transcriptional regulator [Euzebya tangerina]|uniref:TetR/AcrR family transcriptional regulator n=1 Tax=Euzebya tangerina TaxID=591198 RepID=UPI0013C2F162|nr:TetR/AcrR family transcriptional regulator [Euzebya tangerina]
MTRAKLLQAAADELIETGGSLEVAAVARRAETSIGLTYRYFHNKGALAAAVVEEFFDRQNEAVLMATIDADGWRERERRRIELMVAFHYSEPLAKVALGGLAREPEVAAVMMEKQAGQAAIVAAMLARGQDLGFIDPSLDPSVAGAMVLGAIREAIRVALAAGEHLDAGALTEQILTFVDMATRLRT